MADLRRIAGIALIVLAGLGVAAAPALRPPIVGGTAIAAPVPAAPRVGDCVQPPARLPQRVSSGIPTDGYGPCDGLRAGEIVSVVADPWVDPGAGDSHTAMRDGSPEDAVQGQCALDARLYAGLPAALPTVEPAGGSGLAFRPSIWLPVAPLYPDDRQRASGQTWVACVVESPTGDDFRGSMRDVFARDRTSGTLPSVFARCLVDEASGTAIGCDDPHQVEMLGFLLVRDAPDTARQARAACTAFVATVLKRDDPTADGALAVVSRYDPSVHEATCGVAVVGDRRLAGSLIGVGNRPLPWVG